MSSDYQRIEQAIHFIRTNVREQPGLQATAAHVGLSPFHFQRLFRRWAGISPKRFLEYLTVRHARQLLRDSQSILAVSYAVGLSGAGRLHDHFISIEAMSPGEYRQQGRGLQIRYGVHASPFGDMLLAATARGICSLGFLADAQLRQELIALQQDWPQATFIEDHAYTAVLAGKIFDRGAADHQKLPLLVRGTNFQVNVWRALLKIPPGRIASYQQLARLLGKPKAHRSVASAIAANPVAYLIPCHRVLRSTGEIGQYHWGTTRKQAMVAWELARLARQDDATD